MPADGGWSHRVAVRNRRQRIAFYRGNAGLGRVAVSWNAAGFSAAWGAQQPKRWARGARFWSDLATKARSDAEHHDGERSCDLHRWQGRTRAWQGCCRTSVARETDGGRSGGGRRCHPSISCVWRPWLYLWCIGPETSGCKLHHHPRRRGRVSIRSENLFLQRQ